MTTIRDVIGQVDALKPNAFEKKQKVRWLALLDGKLAADVFLMDIGDISKFEYKFPECLDHQLLVSYPHDDIYEYWLMAQIDMANGEYDKYNNAMAMYNASLDAFTAWFAQTYDPAQGYERKVDYEL